MEIKSHVDSNDLKNILELKFETDIRSSNTIFRYIVVSILILSLVFLINSVC